MYSVFVDRPLLSGGKESYFLPCLPVESVSHVAINLQFGLLKVLERKDGAESSEQVEGERESERVCERERERESYTSTQNEREGRES